MQPSHPSAADMPYDQDTAQPGGPLPEPSNRTAAFVLGLLSLVIPYVGFILGPIAIVLSRKGRKEVSQGLARGDGLLTAGFILGVISTCLYGLAIIATVIAVAIFPNINPGFRPLLAKSQIQRMSDAIELELSADRGKAKAMLADLKGWAASKGLPKTDPWDRDYEFKSDAAKNWYEIRSRGADTDDAADDIVYDSATKRVIAPDLDTP